MIVCSCNVFSDHQVRSTVAQAARRPRMSQIYGRLGSGAKCGRCAHTIRRVMDDTAYGAPGFPDPASRSGPPGRRQS
jgi:bacterioferritin-associated ferredoxin